MDKHLMPQNDIIPHTVSKECHCNPILSQAVIRYEQIFFYRHNSFDLMDLCEKVGIKTNEVWEIKYEV